MYFTSSGKDKKRNHSANISVSKVRTLKCAYTGLTGSWGSEIQPLAIQSTPLERQICVFTRSHYWELTPWYREHHHYCSLGTFQGTFSKAPTDFGSVHWASKASVFCNIISALLKPGHLFWLESSWHFTRVHPIGTFLSYSTIMQGRLDMPVVQAGDWDWGDPSSWALFVNLDAATVTTLEPPAVGNKCFWYCKRYICKHVLFTGYFASRQYHTQWETEWFIQGKGFFDSGSWQQICSNVQSYKSPILFQMQKPQKFTLTELLKQLVLLPVEDLHRQQAKVIFFHQYY